MKCWRPPHMIEIICGLWESFTREFLEIQIHSPTVTWCLQNINELCNMWTRLSESNFSIGSVQMSEILCAPQKVLWLHDLSAVQEASDPPQHLSSYLIFTLMRHLNYNFNDQLGLLRELGKVWIEKPEASTKSFLACGNWGMRIRI